MARSTDPLRRDTIEVVARLPQTRVEAPTDNAALRLADSIARLSPEAQRTMQSIAEERAAEARAQAKRDAIANSGAELADATREGRIRPTQNPWYVNAYNRESAAIRAQDQLAVLQADSATWPERDDAQAFAARWREEVGAIAEGYTTTEQIAGFAAAEAASTSQVLQQNTARNAARIETERRANLGRLSSDALQRVYVANGGRMSPNQAWEALAPSRQQWFATGGDEEGWNAIVVESITSAAYANGDENILDLLRAPELLSGPSQIGSATVISPDSPYSGITTIEVPPSEASLAAAAEAGEEPPAPSLTVTAPQRSGFEIALPVEGRISSGFGRRRAPLAGASTDHRAIDITAPAGTPIRAQAVGRVLSVEREGNAGNVVRVDYGNGVVASYAHMQGFEVEAGDIVSPGQSLGGVGRTGNATGNHVHYTLRVNGERVDPTAFRGQIGGDFEGVQRREGPPPAAQSFPGFPGQDVPYRQEDLPDNTYAFGPSLYGMAGVADQVEADRYRINAAAEAAPLQRARILENERKARAFQARDYIYEQYGTGVLTGQVTRETIIEDLAGQNYSAPEIALALNYIRDPLQDSVAVANAQVAARGQTPEGAVSVLELETEGRTNGYSPEYEGRVVDAILRGDITGADGTRMIGNSRERDRQIESDARSDRAEARAIENQRRADEPPGSRVESASELSNLSGNLASATVLAVQSSTGSSRAINMEDDVEASILRAARAHLATNPGDWDGAVSAARAEAARLGRVLTQRLQPAERTGRRRRGGSNPRENN